MYKILIIEDDPSITKVIATRLKRENYELLVAVDGEEGQRRAKSEKPDLVLLDLMLPKVDGFEVLRELKAAPETKDAPVIVLSNLGQSKDIEEAMRLGAVDYLIKTDFSINQIVDKVKENLEKTLIKNT